MKTLREKMGIGKKQVGLASVEAVLIMPILLMLMYITVQSAKTMVVYEQRTIEARNAAYTVELYSGGEVRLLDEIRQSADEAVQGIESGLSDAIAQADTYAEYLNLIGVDVGQVGDYVQQDYLEILQKFPIQRYATVSEESEWFYDSMLELAIDKQDEFSSTDDPNIVSNGTKIKDLYQVLRDERSKSGVTVGVSVSPYTGPLGVFAPFNGQFFMRNYHAADFATTLNLDDITINKDEVIDNGNGYVLKAGYSKEMKEMLAPDLLFRKLFADPDNDTLEVPGIIDLPFLDPIDPTVGIVNDPDPADDAAFQAYKDSGGRKGRSRWDLAGQPANRLVDELSWGKNYARRKLDIALGGVTGDGLDAHHIIPLEAISAHPELMRLAAEGGFNINGANSGMLLTPEQHNLSVFENHHQYNQHVLGQLAQIDLNQTPAQIAAQVQAIASGLKTQITNSL